MTEYSEAHEKALTLKLDLAARRAHEAVIAYSAAQTLGLRCNEEYREADNELRAYQRLYAPADNDGYPRPGYDAEGNPKREDDPV